MGAKYDATLSSLYSQLNRRDNRVSGRNLIFPGLHSTTRLLIIIAHLVSIFDLGSLHRIIQVVSGCVVVRTKHFGDSDLNALRLALLLRDIRFVSLSNVLLTWGEVLAEVRNYSEFSAIPFLGKESASSAGACVYMDYKGAIELGEIM